MPRQARRRTPTVPLALPVPGAYGLNTELKTQVEDPRWALVLQNMTWNDAGRLTLRKGYVDQTTTAISSAAKMWAMHEYVKADATVSLVAAATEVGTTYVRAVTVAESSLDTAVQGYNSSDLNGLGLVSDPFGSIDDSSFLATVIESVAYHAGDDDWRIVLDGGGSLPADDIFTTVRLEFDSGEEVTLASADAAISFNDQHKEWSWTPETSGWEDADITTVKSVTFVVGRDGTGLWGSTDDGDTWSNISGALSSTTPKWVFVNFNGNVYATAPGHKVWQYTGASTFTQIADSPVTSGAMIAAFGRLWVAVDATTQVKYCALLDATDWTGVSAGTLDASEAFAQGTDTLTALGAFGATLVVFAEKQLLIYVDGQGSELGVSPDNLYVVDSIEGVGALEQDTVITIGDGDLWFRSKQGVQSLSRVVQDKVNPKVDVSRHVRSLVQQLDAAETGADGTVKAVHDETRQLVYFLFPTSEKVLVFDVRAPLPFQDGTFRAGEWTSQPFFSLCLRRNGDLLFGLGTGEVAKYTGYRDAGSTAFDLVYATPWVDGGEETHNRLKFLKSVYLDVTGRETLTGTLRWAYDFRPLEFSAAFTSEYASTGAEFGAGEFGEDEYGSGHRSRREFIGVGGQGRVFKLWLTLESTDVDDFFSIQEIGAFTRFGRGT